MFLQLSQDNNGNLQERTALNLLTSPPSRLTFLLDRAWERRLTGFATDSILDALPVDWYGGYANIDLGLANLLPDPGPRRTPHLIYSYCIENTRIYEIFQRVLFEFIHGEKFGIPSDETQLWLRATEELFYRESPHWVITALTSSLRSDLRANRRNAYYRMFGMDLNHGSGDTAAYPYHKPANANTEFVATFEALLREVWKGIMYYRSLVGPIDVDDAGMANLCRRLADMLLTRRRNGYLEREEFCYVAMMSWMHLSVSFNDSPVIRDLQAQAESEAERIRIIGERVGYKAHPKSDDFFRMAEYFSIFFRELEERTYNSEEAVPNLYMPAGVAPAVSTQAIMERIILHWSSATGRNIKARDVNAQPMLGRS